MSRVARYPDATSGTVGTYTHNHASGADDLDYSYVRYRTGLRFWYQMPMTGMVELWAQMQAIDTPFAGWLNDEWGWSDAECDQESRARLQVIVPGPSAAGSRRFLTIDAREQMRAGMVRRCRLAPTAGRTSSQQTPTPRERGSCWILGPKSGSITKTQTTDRLLHVGYAQSEA